MYISSRASPKNYACSGLTNFKYETYLILIQHKHRFDEISMKKLWEIKEERDRIYGLQEMSEEDGIKVAELEMEFAEMDGYSAESSASELLLGLDIPLDQHYGLMSEIAPGWKLRVLLAQALFSNPEILLLDEPTNNLDINSENPTFIFAENITQFFSY